MRVLPHKAPRPLGAFLVAMVLIVSMLSIASFNVVPASAVDGNQGNYPNAASTYTQSQAKSLIIGTGVSTQTIYVIGSTVVGYDVGGNTHWSWDIPNWGSYSNQVAIAEYNSTYIYVVLVKVYGTGLYGSEFCDVYRYLLNVNSLAYSSSSRSLDFSGYTSVDENGTSSVSIVKYANGTIIAAGHGMYPYEHETYFFLWNLDSGSFFESMYTETASIYPSETGSQASIVIPSVFNSSVYYLTMSSSGTNRTAIYRFDPVSGSAPNCTVSLVGITGLDLTFGNQGVYMVGYNSDPARYFSGSQYIDVAYIIPEAGSYVYLFNIRFNDTYLSTVNTNVWTNHVVTYTAPQLVYPLTVVYPAGTNESYLASGTYSYVFYGGNSYGSGVGNLPYSEEYFTLGLGATPSIALSGTGVPVPWTVASGHYFMGPFTVANTSVGIAGLMNPSSNVMAQFELFYEPSPVWADVMGGAGGAVLSAYPTTVSMGGQTTFTLSYSGGMTIVNVTLDYGDGGSLYSPYMIYSQVKHYLSVGSYSTNFTLGFSDGTTLDSNAVTITVVASGAATLTVTPSNVTQYSPVTISLSYYGGNAISYINYSTGDGGLYSVYGSPVPFLHTYTSAGLFYVTALIVFTDTSTLIPANAMVNVTALSGGGLAFTSNTTVISAGGYVMFTATYTGTNYPQSMLFTFGDGNAFGSPWSYAVSNAISCSELYFYAGTYTANATLTFLDSTSVTSANVTITVLPAVATGLVFTASSTTVSQGQLVNFTFDYTGGESPASFTIFFGDGSAFGAPWSIVVGGIYSHNYSYPASGTFNSYVAVIFSNGTNLYSNVVIITVTGGTGTLVLSVIPATVAQCSTTVVAWSYTGGGTVMQKHFLSGDGVEWDFTGLTLGVTGFPFSKYRDVGTFTAKAWFNFSDGSSVMSNNVIVTVTTGTCTVSPTPVPDVGLAILDIVGVGGLWLVWIVLAFAVSIILYGMGAGIALGLLAGFVGSGAFVWILDPADMVGAFLLSIVIGLLMAVLALKGGVSSGGGGGHF